MPDRTPSQVRAIASIRRRLEHSINEFTPNTYEVYEWEETDYEHFVSIVAKVDVIGANYHIWHRVYQVFVGRKGGIKQVCKGYKRHQQGFRPWLTSI